MPKVIHFEFPAVDPQRAIAFYASAFGWECTDYTGSAEYWVAQCGDTKEPGINGAIMARRGEGQPVVTILNVPSVEEACAAVVAAGGVIVVPRFEIPGLGFKAYFKDTEGNIVGMAELPGGDI